MVSKIFIQKDKIYGGIVAPDGPNGWKIGGKKLNL